MSNSTHPLVLATEFDAFSKLPADLVPTSFQVMKFAGKYLKVEGDGKRWFDWAGFNSAVGNYQGDDLTLDKFKNTTIAQSNNTVDTIVNKIVDFLIKALSIALNPTSIAAIAATIEATYTNLKEESSEGFLDFNKSSDGHNSSWEYRIQFAFPDENLPEYFYSLVTTILLVADIKEESGWWGLTSSTSKNFSATIDAMELVVKKGFTNPA